MVRCFDGVRLFGDNKEILQISKDYLRKKV